MRYVKKFEQFKSGKMNEEFVNSPQTSPSPSPTIAPPITKPDRPTKPGKPIIQPSVDPQPKAEHGKKTAEDVAKRFISELEEKGEDIEKYLNK